MANLEGWLYRKKVTVTGSTDGAQTDYTIPITVHFGSGTDSGDDVYCSEHCATDFDDIRFTAADGTTILSHWRESKTDSDNAVYWIKIPSIDASPATLDVYAYYGNMAAGDTSDIDGAFLFGDDFGDDQGPGYDTFVQTPYGLAPGDSSAWDYKIREKCTIIRDSSITGNAWDMWYCGYSSAGTTTSNIGHAYSSDGLTWIKDANNPVVSSGTKILQDPSVVEFGGELLMYVEYTQVSPEGYDVELYIYDSDTSVWSPYANNPVLPASKSATPLAHVMPSGTTVRLFFEDFANGKDVSYSDSTDGRVFGTPVASVVALAGSDSIPDSIVEDINNPGVWHLFFHTSIARRVARATSSDLSTWEDVKLIPPGSQFESSVVINQGSEVWAYIWDQGGEILGAQNNSHGGYYLFKGYASSGQSIDTDKWTVTEKGSGGFIDVGGSYACLYCDEKSTSGGSINLQTVPTFENNVAIEVKKAVGFFTYANCSFGSGALRSQDNLTSNWWLTCQVDSYVQRFKGVGTDNFSILKIGSGSITEIGTSSPVSAPTYINQHIDQLTYTSGGALTWKTNGSVVGAANDTTYLSDSKRYHISAGGYSAAQSRVYLDWVRVRKFTVNEPAITAYATEEYFPDDDTAPNLTDSTATATGPTTATASVTTDDGNGTLYFLASENSTESAATVKAALSQSVTASGEQSISLSALDPATTYYVHFVQINGAGLESASVVTTSAITTPAIVYPEISATTAASTTSAVSATVTTDTAGGTIYGVLSTSATEMEADDIKSGADDSAGVTDAGDYTLNETGLATWTQYYWHIAHEDADGLMSNVLTIPVKTLDISIPLAFSDTAPATLLTVQVWGKLPKKADVEGLY